ncbi:hypothetical protein AC249_AIPGENE28223 [Exaiptasia diaphana]|nr:hypothetical protein AC249_AIPGENE28223 [Exaiptasia diaphana]
MASVGGKKHVKTNDVGRRHSPKSAKVTALQSDREAENNEIITSQEKAFKQEQDKLNAKVAELQSELQTKHFEEKIWYTVFANLTDKLKRLESELEKNIMKENNAKSKVNCKAAESSALKEKRKVIFEDDDAKKANHNKNHYDTLANITFVHGLHFPSCFEMENTVALPIG